MKHYEIKCWHGELFEQLTTEDVVALAQRGRISGECLIREYGQSTWREVRDIRRFAKHLGRSARHAALPALREAADQGEPRAQYDLAMRFVEGILVGQSPEQAANWFRKAAQQGHVEAQYRLASCYRVGLGVVKDPVAAVIWLNKAAEEGHTQAQSELAQAQFVLGTYHERGQGVESDLAEAFKWFRKSAESGHAEGQLKVGEHYELGDGVAQDVAEAAKWYLKAAEQDQVDACLFLGVCYEWGEGVRQDFAEAVKCYSRAAKQGIIDAQSLLDTCSPTVGRGGRGPADAANWLSAATRQERANRLGSVCVRHLTRRNGVNGRDRRRRVRWLHIAAANGCARAQQLLGCHYKSGDGVAQDDALAMRWWHIAAENGCVDQQFDFGMWYECGHGVAQDAAEAAKWYRKAAEQGHANAQYALARLLGEGRGVPRDLSEAVRWFRKAAMADAREFALPGLSWCYAHIHGLVVESEEAVPWSFEEWERKVEEWRNDSTAILNAAVQLILAMFDLSNCEVAETDWLRKAAEQGNRDAQFHLGELYADSCYCPVTDISKDHAKAAYWFRRAADQGDADAVEALHKLVDE